MTDRATERLVGYLGELGPRWGLPADACRLHGYLYLVARRVPEAELARAVGLDEAATADALAWLGDYGLVDRTTAGWRTGTDPWELVLTALAERRRRELAPALQVLRDCHQAALADGGDGPVVAAQIGKLRDLAEDVAAIDMQGQRLSPQTLRRIVGLGGRTARLIDRTVGGGRRE